MFFTKRPGTVHVLPGPPPFSWVVKATVVVRAGQVLPAAGYTSDALAFFVVTAPDRAQTERRLRQVETWFLSELVIDQDGPAELPVAS